MKSIIRSFFWDHIPGVRWLLVVFGVSYLVALVAGLAHLFNIYIWIGLAREEVLAGQVWRIVTYGLTPAGLLDWLFGLLWFSVLGGQVGRVWSSRTFWCYYVVATVGAAVPVVALLPNLPGYIVGSAPFTFGLLVAWYRLCGFEPLILHGLGRVTVRQAAVIIGLLNAAIVYVGCGWKLLLCMLCGGVAVWLGLSVQRRWNIFRTRQASGGSRIDRLEV